MSDKPRRRIDKYAAESRLSAAYPLFGQKDGIAKRTPDRRAARRAAPKNRRRIKWKINEKNH
jgi:hypothetical protein